MYSTLLGAVVFASNALAVTFTWDCTNSQGPCNNWCYASTWGPSNWGELTYDSNKANRNPRRTASGCNSNPCNSFPWNVIYGWWGDSCDEFPFASVTQGGKGAYLRCVAASEEDGYENSSEGGQLGNFYKTISSGTQFDVVVKNYDFFGLCTAVLGAFNDGGEFTKGGFGFEDAGPTRRRARRDFQTHNPTGQAKKLRTFINANGERLISLNPNMNGTLVGKEVWDNGTMVRVVSEVTS